MEYSIINKLVHKLSHPWNILDSIVYHNPKLWPDKLFLQILYRARMGRSLNLKDPKSFSEKLQWLKLYNRRPEYTIMVDKVKAKDYVAHKLGDVYIIPTLGVWDDPDKIDFDSLPEQFVLKCNHNSGIGMYICKDKSKMDVEKVKHELRRGLKDDYYLKNREWPYKNVPRCIFAEQYLVPTSIEEDLTDYKWYCFDGEPKFCQVIQNRSSNETIDFFDTEWNHQEFIGLNPEAVSATVLPKRPVNLKTHLRIAKELSKGIPFVRIDLYETSNRTFFGEITFFPMSGFGYFNPKVYNVILGKMIVLPSEKRKELK